MPTSIQPDKPEAARLADVLRVVADEMAVAGQIVIELQTEFSSFAPALGRKAMSAMQGLDLLTQRLQGVGIFLTALGPTLPAAYLCDAISAARGVTLAGLARRLANPERESDDGEAAETGELELFV